MQFTATTVYRVHLLPLGHVPACGSALPATTDHAHLDCLHPATCLPAHCSRVHPRGLFVPARRHTALPGCHIPAALPCLPVAFCLPGSRSAAAAHSAFGQFPGFYRLPAVLLLPPTTAPVLPAPPSFTGCHLPHLPATPLPHHCIRSTYVLVHVTLLPACHLPGFHRTFCDFSLPEFAVGTVLVARACWTAAGLFLPACLPASHHYRTVTCLQIFYHHCLGHTFHAWVPPPPFHCCHCVYCLPLRLRSTRTPTDCRSVHLAPTATTVTVLRITCCSAFTTCRSFASTRYTCPLPLLAPAYVTCTTAAVSFTTPPFYRLHRTDGLLPGSPPHVAVSAAAFLHVVGISTCGFCPRYLPLEPLRVTWVGFYLPPPACLLGSLCRLPATTDYLVLPTCRAPPLDGFAGSLDLFRACYLRSEPAGLPVAFSCHWFTTCVHHYHLTTDPATACYTCADSCLTSCLGSPGWITPATCLLPSLARFLSSLLPFAFCATYLRHCLPLLPAYCTTHFSFCVRRFAAIGFWFAIPAPACRSTAVAACRTVSFCRSGFLRAGSLDFYLPHTLTCHRRSRIFSLPYRPCSPPPGCAVPYRFRFTPPAFHTAPHCVLRWFCSSRCGSAPFLPATHPHTFCGSATLHRSPAFTACLLTAAGAPHHARLQFWFHLRIATLYAGYLLPPPLPPATATAVLWVAPATFRCRLHACCCLACTCRRHLPGFSGCCWLPVLGLWILLHCLYWLPLLPPPSACSLRLTALQFCHCVPGNACLPRLPHCLTALPATPLQFYYHCRSGFGVLLDYLDPATTHHLLPPCRTAGCHRSGLHAHMRGCTPGFTALRHRIPPAPLPPLPFLTVDFPPRTCCLPCPALPVVWVLPPPAYLPPATACHHLPQVCYLPGFARLPRCLPARCRCHCACTIPALLLPPALPRYHRRYTPPPRFTCYPAVHHLRFTLSATTRSPFSPGCHYHHTYTTCYTWISFYHTFLQISFRSVTVGFLTWDYALPGLPFGCHTFVRYRSYLLTTQNTVLRLPVLVTIPRSTFLVVPFCSLRYVTVTVHSTLRHTYPTTPLHYTFTVLHAPFLPRSDYRTAIADFTCLSPLLPAPPPHPGFYACGCAVLGYHLSPASLLPGPASSLPACTGFLPSSIWLDYTPHLPVPGFLLPACLPPPGSFPCGCHTCLRSQLFWWSASHLPFACIHTCCSFLYLPACLPPADTYTAACIHPASRCTGATTRCLPAAMDCLHWVHAAPLRCHCLRLPSPLDSCTAPPPTVTFCVSSSPATLPPACRYPHHLLPPRSLGYI